MKKVKVLAPAKVNFTLDISGVENGFHNICSLVNTVSICDTIVVKKRKDNEIRLFSKGVDAGCSLEKNNAYKTAVEFVKEYGVSGVDIHLKKRIPVGGGLGGSSADVAGVLNAMKQLFDVKDDLSYIANRLGSDTAYLINGGWAVIQGRGEIITPLAIKTQFYLVMIKEDSGVSAGECYKAFDKLEKTDAPTTFSAVDCLTKGDLKGFYNSLKNDLYAPAKTFVPNIENNLNALKEYAPAFMTGSGSITVGVFLDKKIRDKAYKDLRRRFGNKVLKATTV